jgi:hypothetical protein
MITETPFSKKRMGFVVWGNLNFAWITMIKKKGGSYYDKKNGRCFNYCGLGKPGSRSFC